MNFNIKLVENKVNGRESKIFTTTKKQYDIIEKKAIINNRIKYFIETVSKTREKMKYEDLMVWGQFKDSLKL